MQNPLQARWKIDYAFKTIVNSFFSLGITIAFALYNGYLGILRRSVWHGSICVFYLLLVLIRGSILLPEKRNNKTSNLTVRARSRYKTFLISATMLFVLNMALIGPIVLMVRLEKPVNLGLIPAIAMAAYTTYKITMASVHIRRQKRSGHNNILVTELRTINLIDALVSILTLQNTLIMVKSTTSETDRMLTLSTVSNTAIYILIVLITIRLLQNGRKQNRHSPLNNP